MLHKIVPLSEVDSEIYLEVFAADKMENFTRRAILIIPGGSYNSLSDREGSPIAHAFIPHGFNAFVLHYSVGRKRPYPAQLIEASLAVKHIRDHAEEYNINPEEVYAAGFSAGGHLAASLAVFWDRAEIYAATGMQKGENRPNGVLLLYPVIAAGEEFSHPGSFRNLLCKDEPTAEELAYVSAEKHVTAESVPAFIMHTVNDQVVNVRNALAMAESYRAAGVPFEMHIYPDAPHGVALGNAITAGTVEKWNNPAIAKWVEHAAEWIRQL